MRRLVAVGEQRVDPRKAFGVAWVASFLSLVAILGLTFFVMYAFTLAGA
jgi:hypothetical protein